MKKLKIVLCTLMILFVFSSGSVLACSAVYVGKDVSADGSTIFARSEDQSTGAYNKMFKVVERVENESGRTIDDVNGFSYKLPETTYKYTIIPDSSTYEDGPYYGASTNEFYK